MMSLKFLILEDSILDAELITALLAESEIECESIQVKTRSEFQVALERGGFDLILSDYSLPGFDGISALVMARQLCPDVPFIFVTATMGEEVAIETLKGGATDYVLKQRLERLIPAVERSLREAAERRARVVADEYVVVRVLRVATRRRAYQDVCVGRRIVLPSQLTQEDAVEPSAVLAGSRANKG